jgi:hypothetical protein
LPWEEFLCSKAADPSARAARVQRIREWQAVGGRDREISPELVSLAEQATIEVIEVFERKIAELRSARAKKA